MAVLWYPISYLKWRLFTFTAETRGVFCVNIFFPFSCPSANSHSSEVSLKVLKSLVPECVRGCRALANSARMNWLEWIGHGRPVQRKMLYRVRALQAAWAWGPPNVGGSCLLGFWVFVAKSYCLYPESFTFSDVLVSIVDKYKCLLPARFSVTQTGRSRSLSPWYVLLLC